MPEDDERFIMSAREDDYCVACLEPIHEGEDVVHDAQVGGWLHLACT